MTVPEMMLDMVCPGLHMQLNCGQRHLTAAVGGACLSQLGHFACVKKAPLSGILVLLRFGLLLASSVFII